MASRKVILVGWDAADWKVIRPLIDAGKMPNVKQLVLQGACGQIATLHPPISPMLWTSIATGKRPFKHGIHGFSEPTPDGRGVQPVSNLSRKSKALWNILNQNDLRSIVIGWWPSHPAEPIDGVMVSDHYHRASGPLAEAWPLPANCVHPAELADILAAQRVHPEVLAPELVEQFIPLAREIDQEQDPRLALFLRTLAECMSIHAAASWLIASQPWDFFAVYYDAIDHFCHGFMKYHAPRQSWIEPRDFELYGNVVSMAYQFHDRMLGALLREAGDDATVLLLSDHGFHPDHLRPASIPDIPAGPTIEHRDFGILAMSGPGIKRDEILHGASVLDVAPTILKLYGLPVGGDMDGKVLARAFVDNTSVAMIPSWEDVPGADGRHPPHMQLDPVAAQEALEQMIALGYIEQPDENRQIAVARTIRELRYNLGEAYQDGDRHIEAREIFAELHAADPDEQRLAVRLFVSCQALGMTEEMRRIVVEEARRVGQAVPPAGFHSSISDGRRNRLPHNSPVFDYLNAQLLISEKRYAEALAVLERVAEPHLARPGLLLQTGDLYLRLGKWQDAQGVYEKALAMDPDNAQAHIGICRIALGRRKYGAAAHSALDALQRVHHFPQAHFLLGRALSGMQEYERAAEAYRAAISFNPNYPEAHVRLAALLEKHLGDAESGREHRRLAREMRERKAARPVNVNDSPSGVSEPRPFGSLWSRLSEAGKEAGLKEGGLKGPASIETAEMPPLAETLIVVTGLPRSGTSLLMQMLAAGGMDVLSDNLREADDDNPRGYLEFEPVKHLFQDAKWLFEKRGKAVKIVAPLLAALPHGLACRVILSERDFDEILDSQERMLARRNQPLAEASERRRMLKEEYARTVSRVRAMLAQRPGTHLLVIQHSDAISHPLSTAGKLNKFLGGELDVAKMAAAIDAALHRRGAATRGGEPASDGSVHR